MNKISNYNLNIERAVLSSIIFNAKIFEDVSDKISAKDFYLPFHSYLFHAMVELFKEEKPIEEEFLRAKLTHQNRFDELTMIDILSVNAISNTMAYVDEIKKMSIKRATNSVLDNAKMKTLEAGEIIEQLKDIEEGSDWNLGLTSANNLDNTPVSFILKDFLPLPQGALSFISSNGGVGKTYASLQIAIRYIISQNYNKKAFLWLAEDPQSVIDARLKQIFGFMGLQKSVQEKIKSCLFFTSKTPPLLLIANGYKSNTISPIFYKIKKQLKGFGLIILDPLASFFGGNENENSEVNIFMSAFKGWAMESQTSILFLHHNTKGDGKGSGMFRGATAWRDACRIAYELDFCRDEEGNLNKEKQPLRVFKLTKDNWGGGLHKQLSIGQSIEIQTVPKNIKMLEVTYEDELNGSFSMPLI